MRSTRLEPFGEQSDPTRELLPSRVADDADAGTTEWRKLERHRRLLAEWLIDQVTDASGEVQPVTVDAGLGGDLYVPGSFTYSVCNRCYRMSLTATTYEVTEVFVTG